MRWTGFGIAAAALAAAAVVPMSALGDNAAPVANATGGGWFAGAVTSAGPTAVTLDVLWTGKHDTQLDGTSVTVGIDSSTQIVYGKGKSGIGSGDLIGVGATGIGTSTLTAKRIHVRCNCHFAAGTLGSVGQGSFALDVTKTGPYDTVLNGNAVTFQVNGSTTFVQGKASAPGALSALKTGEKVGVIFAASGFFKDPSFNWQTATFTASTVHYRGAILPNTATP